MHKKRFLHLYYNQSMNCFPFYLESSFFMFYYLSFDILNGIEIGEENS